MCGIYFCAGTKLQVYPKIFSEYACENDLPQLGTHQRSIHLFGDELDEIIENDRQCRTRLDQESERKIKIVPKLRQLQLDLNWAKNARNTEECRRIQDLMDSLQQEEKTTQRSYCVDRTLQAVMNRGPDYCLYTCFTNKSIHYLLLSSVLSLRQPFTRQPMVQLGLILQYNGELYDERNFCGNDTKFVFDRLQTAVASVMDGSGGPNRESAILSAVSDLNGEYAFVVTDLVENTVYFGKDSVGKRSLLYFLEANEVVVASVLPNKEDIVECKGGIVYKVDLKSFELSSCDVASTTCSRLGPDLSLSLLDIIDRVNTLNSKLSKACLVRQKTINPLYKDSNTLQIGVLFSGGLDCTVITALLAQNYASEVTPVEIDLLSVGFENPRTGMTPAELPDRILGERSWRELCTLFAATGVSFRFVQVDVSYEQWLCHKQAVQDLIHPTKTEMDLSIAIAFYFACRARDCRALEVSSKPDLSFSFETKQDYTSKAKVLFSGLGADELFGGYSRHEGVFHPLEEESSTIGDLYRTLNSELANDIAIIYQRNLGRDDRAMASWGKELRYPYLDRLVIEYAFEGIEPNLKVKISWQDQVTKKGVKRVKKFERKHVLRELGRKIGLLVASEEPKRAIQFGAKTAKMEIGLSKAKGTDAL